MNRAERRRQERTQAKRQRMVPGYHPRKTDDRLNDDGNYGIVVAWCATEADLPETRHQTHDILIDRMGGSRRGGVQWLQHEGEEARAALSRMYEGSTPELTDHYRRVGAHLREYGGWLVIALAEGEIPS